MARNQHNKNEQHKNCIYFVSRKKKKKLHKRKTLVLAVYKYFQHIQSCITWVNTRPSDLHLICICSIYKYSTVIQYSIQTCNTEFRGEKAIFFPTEIDQLNKVLKWIPITILSVFEAHVKMMTKIHQKYIIS